MVSISVKQICNIYSLLFQPYEYKNVSKLPTKTAFFLKAIRLQLFN